MRYRRPVVQLTALLDLLFIMIFVSLNHQTKAEPEVKAPVPEVVQEAPTPKEYSVAAEFHFYGTDQNPNIPVGAYAMKGTFNPANGKLQLGGTNWINQPRDYDMIPLNGIINKNQTHLKGSIEFSGCKEFVLMRASKEKGSEIAGDWIGKYVCLQGETGLTLKIK
jgi:hypothetical protein